MAHAAAPNPAETYDQFFVPAMFAPQAAAVLQRIAPPPGARVLDIACGTGIVARQAAALVGPTGQVVGLDLNPAMLAVARSHPAPAGAAITWQEGNALALPYPEASFDLVLCQQGLQFVPDRALALREMRRVLVAGGRVAIAVNRALAENPFFREFNETLARRLGSPTPLAPFALGDADTLRDLLVGAGFQDVAIETLTLTLHFPSAADFVRLSVLSSAVVMPDVAQLAPEARQRLIAAVAEEAAPALHPYRDGAGLTGPLAIHLGTARA